MLGCDAIHPGVSWDGAGIDTGVDHVDRFLICVFFFKGSLPPKSMVSSLVLIMALLASLASATCTNHMVRDNMFHQQLDWSNGGWSTVFSDWAPYGGQRACDVSLGSYTFGKGISFGCNGRYTSFADLGTLDDLTTKYSLSTATLAYSSLRLANNSNVELVISRANVYGGPTYQNLNFTWPTPASLPSITPPLAGHLYVARMTDAVSSSSTLSIVVKFYITSIVFDAEKNINTMDIMWDVLFINTAFNGYYTDYNSTGSAGVPCFVTAELPNGPLETSVRLQQPSCTCASGDEISPTGDLVFKVIVGIALSVVAAVAIISLILVINLKKDHGYKEVPLKTPVN